MSEALSPITLRDLYRARHAIAPFIRRTPLIYSPGLSLSTGAHVYLKLENQQETGTFKLRGAANRLLALTQAERQRGVITVSTGNHGRAVAAMAQRLAMRAVICVPELVLPHKVAAMRTLGAEVVIHGRTQDDAERYAQQLQAEQGLTMVSAFDEPYIIAGQGTIGLEILEDLPQVDTLIAPLSGGGLLGGIAIAMKSASPHIHVVGVSQALGPAMALSLQAGAPVAVVEEPSLADSLLGGIGLANHYTFPLIRDFVDEVVLLDEVEIASAMIYALHQEKQIVEGGGSVALGALLANKVSHIGESVVVVVSGGNVELEKLLALAAQ
ncbi:MAG: pyridoxal-phosphate dependent enzyme [Caldilineaceae bacterium]|nr:pyridoxal-phosphate dependent enzyme [Caldilineaceae bacterium]